MIEVRVKNIHTGEEVLSRIYKEENLEQVYEYDNDHFKTVYNLIRYYLYAEEFGNASDYSINIERLPDEKKDNQEDNDNEDREEFGHKGDLGCD
jgi:hypothetical protein